MTLIIRLGLPVVLLALIQLASALPLERDGVVALSAAQISTYKIYAQFARVGYCPSSKTKNWTCGEACNSITGFTTYAVGGDGGNIPYWYVGYHAGSHSVVVSNQGSDFERFEALLIDARFFQKNLNSTLFPGVSKEVKVHSFADAQAMSAGAKLAAIQSAMASAGTNSITLTGHSLGGAISLLDSLYLSLSLPSAKFKVVTHGLPRVGNKEFADLIDSKIPDLSRITNMQDLVPILPGRGLGYAHPNGEKRILAPGSWTSCAGHDNTDKSCTTGAVPTILNGNANDHRYVIASGRPTSGKDVHTSTVGLLIKFSMQQVTSYIKQAFLYPGAMIATPIVGALMLVAIGGGALDDAIVGVPESFMRWWKGTLVQKKRVLTHSNDNITTRKPSELEFAIEQLEIHARKERQKRIAEQEAATLSVKPIDKPSTRMSPPVSSPRVIGTRRRRSRGGSCDMEMQSF
ncbi:unnamed protein product [Rhizoctonia solani]|uniref:Fungal lipase-type domain-containing protein n=1 Tax=Rhizoctonia solani TaxID=456999 RepID=A0A8H3BT73_9AGAM|nr:unnamed protein product [Rhizoctonia solani]